MKSRAGLSLIETMVAMAILSVVLLAILALAATSRRTARQAELGFQASVLAQNLLEREKAKNYPDLIPGGPTALSLDEVDTTLPDAKAERTIREVEGFDGRLKEIALKVSWSEPGRHRSSVWLIRVSDIPR
jgi:prepilin-type N-terminal cleavage/methylation domain-containing protein